MQINNYVLGLDLGTNSIGYACVDEKTEKIIKAGVRIFDAAENAKTGASLALPRREARLKRRRLRRRKERIRKIKKLLIENRITDEAKILYAASNNIWALRKKGIYEKLTNEELYKVIYHIVKNRGFKSSKKDRKSEIKEKDDKAKELQKANACMETLEKEFKNSGYKTIGEFLYLKHYENGQAIRNKDGDYKHTIKRALNEKELKLILEIQKDKFKNNLITDSLISDVFKIFNFQKGIPSFEEKVGSCGLEADRKRAPKDSISSCLLRAYQMLNNFKYKNEDGKEEKTLSRDIIKNLITKVFEEKTIKEKTIAEIIGLHKIKTENNAENKTEDKTAKPKNEYRCNIELKKISKSLEFKSYHELKDELTKIGKWESLKNNYKALDAIVYALAYLKEYNNFDKLVDCGMKKEIENACLSEDDLKELFERLSYDKAGSYSLKAIYKILPYYENAEENITLDKIIKEVYPNIYNFKTEGKKYIPEFNFENYDKPNTYKLDNITNAVLKRCLCQTRLLINKVIYEYGKPKKINIELARELGKSFDDRKKLRKIMDEQEEKNKTFANEAEKNKVANILMYILWKEQDCICMYSGKTINIEDMQNECVEIDHILPISQSADDSKKNKVLVFAYENQNKGNKSAFDYIKSKGDKELESYIIRVGKHIKSRAKKHRLLLENFEEKSGDYKTRHLNDTRYITREIKNLLEKTIKPKDMTGIYVNVMTGETTHVFRKLWAMGEKNREEDNRHHATDALIIAGVGDAIHKFNKEVTIASHYNFREDKGLKKTERIEKNLKRFGFSITPPWESFSEDARRYIEQEIFVSRMGRKKITGQAHEETIKSERKDGKIIKRINLSKVEKKYYTEDGLKNYLSKMIDFNARNKFLYDMILKHAKEYGYKMDEAFSFENAPSMPNNKNAKIRHIKIIDSASSFLMLKNMSSEKRKARVDSGDIVRLDLFKDSKGKYFVIPVYTFHISYLPIPQYENSEFQFSIYKNDYIVCEADKKFTVLGKSLNKIEGYYNTASKLQMRLVSHNSNKNNFLITISVMDSIKKYRVDMLGRKHLMKTPEKRLTLKEAERSFRNKRKK